MLAAFVAALALDQVGAAEAAVPVPRRSGLGALLARPFRSLLARKRGLEPTDAVAPTRQADADVSADLSPALPDAPAAMPPAQQPLFEATQGAAFKAHAAFAPVLRAAASVSNRIGPLGADRSAARILAEAVVLSGTPGTTVAGWAGIVTANALGGSASPQEAPGETASVTGRVTATAPAADGGAPVAVPQDAPTASSVPSGSSFGSPSNAAMSVPDQTIVVARQEASAEGSAAFAASSQTTVDTAFAARASAETDVGHTAEYGLNLGADQVVAAGPTTNASNPSTAPTSGPIKADAAIALNLQTPGTTFGKGGTETTKMSLGQDGTGVTVGILSDSFNTSSYATATSNRDDVAYDQAQGYLPGSVTILQDYGSSSNPGTDEGRGMAQIVHQIAPGSAINFATAYGGEQNFADNILALAKVQGTRVIVDDVGYFDEDTYQSGPIAEAIKQVEAQGILYLSSAGNDASYGYEGKFSAGTTFTITDPKYTPTMTFSYTADNFSTGGSALANSLLPIHVNAGTDIALRWASPAANGGTSATSVLGLYVTDVNGNPLFNKDGLGDSNGAGDTPAQNVYIPMTGDYYLRVGLLDGTPAPTDLKITVNGYGTESITWVASNYNSGTFAGHAATPGAVGTGAVPFYQTPAYNETIQNEPFSSAGPNYFYFDDNGNPLATPLASNVALSGVDGIQTSFFDQYGTLPTGDKGFFFFGTSAAAPSVAGVAALMFEENAGLTPADARNLLQDSATAHPTYASGRIPASGPTPDPQIGGSGLVDGALAVQFSQLTNNTLTIDATGTVLGTHYNDRLTGDAAANMLTGFGGSDTFVFTPTNFATAQKGSASAVTDYDQGNGGSYAASEGDTIDVSAIVRTAFDGGAAADSLVRIDSTPAAAGPFDLQLYVNGAWTTQAILSGIGLNDAVSAVLDPAAAVDTASFHIGVGSSDDLSTAIGSLSAVTTANLRFDLETTADGLSSSQAFALPSGGTTTLTADTGVATLSGVISGSSGGLIKNGAGTLVLSGANTFTGGTTVSVGTLAVANDGNLGDSGGGIDLYGGTLEETTGFASARVVDLANGTVQVDAGSATLSSTITGSGLTKTGAGTLTLSGTNTYTGGTTVDAGTLAVANDGNLGDASGALSLTSGTLEVTAGFTSSRAIVSTRNTFATVQVDSGTATLSGTISGDGTFSKQGAGTLVVSGKNSYGGVAFEAGTLSASSDSNLGASGGGAQFNGGTLEETTGFSSNRQTLFFGYGGGTYQIDQGTATWGGAILGGYANLTKTGTGTLALTNNGNDYAGTTIAAGALDLSYANTASSASISFEAMTGQTATLDLEMSAQNLNGTFANALADFADEDVLDLYGFAGGFVDPLAAPGTLVVRNLAGQAETFTLSGNRADLYIARTDGNGGTIVEDVTCFVTGTRIRTVRGDVAVEALVVGDLAVTASGEHRPIRWIGHRAVDCAAAPPPHDVRPVRILAGMFGLDADGEAVPARELQLSPGHPVLVGSGANEVLVPIMCLINGTSVARKAVDSVTYWHVELEGAHDILLAEGLPAESYLDWGDRPFFGAAAAAHALANPDFVVPGVSARCRPVALDGPVVEAERRRLDAVFTSYLYAQCAWPSPDDLQLGF